MNFLKIISLSLFLFITLSFFFASKICYGMSINNKPGIFNTKNFGKLSMIAMLSIMGLIVKYLNHKDKEVIINIRDNFGLPYNALEFQKGFDIWKLEIYEDRIFIFRNEIFYKSIEL